MNREDALARFKERGFPTTRLEDWKYTDLRPVEELSARWIAAAAEVPGHDEASIRAVQDAIDAHWLVIANGRVIDDLSSIATVDGVTIEDLTDDVIADDDLLADLNAAYRESGTRVTVHEAFNRDRPLGILVADHTNSSPGMSQVRIDIRVESGASLELVEYHVSTGTDEHYSNTLLSLDLDDNAAVNMVRIQVRGESDSQTARLNVMMKRDSHFRLSAFDLGGRLSRKCRAESSL